MVRNALDIRINPEIFKSLLKIQNGLPKHATGHSKTDSTPSYDNPAGLALLGEKEGVVDSVVNLAMSGGCWDAPNVNYTDMDKGFRRMLDQEHQVVGMALIRHPNWNTDQSAEDAKIPTHLRAQIHSMRKSFSNIARTIWIVLHNDYFRIYKPSVDEEKRVTIKEIPFRKLFEKEDLGVGIVKDRITRDSADIQRKIDARKAKQAAKKAQIAAEKERLTAEARRLAAIEEKRRQKIMSIDQKMKEGKDDIIDAGAGFVFMRNRKGEYILWQTPR